MASGAINYGFVGQVGVAAGIRMPGVGLASVEGWRVAWRALSWGAESEKYGEGERSRERGGKG